MNGLYLNNEKLTYRTDLPQPIPSASEALIQVQLAGICATDLEMVKGYVPDFQGVLGHEFVGIVVECAVKEWMGRRVVGSINIGCGDCAVCQQDRPEHCPSRKALGIHQQDGVFADYLVLPIANLFPVPDNVPNEEAVFTEPLAAAVRITEQIDVAVFAETAVVGPGRLGLLIGQVLAHAGTHVTMMGRTPESLKLPQQLGLNTALTGDFPPNSFDLVVEATGNSAGFAHSLELIRPLGTLILKSTFSGNSDLNLTKIVVDEITVLGSRCGPFAPALDLLAQQAIQLAPLIEATYSLKDGIAAFAHAARPGVRKVLIRP